MQRAIATPGVVDDEEEEEEAAEAVDQPISTSTEPVNAAKEKSTTDGMDDANEEDDTVQLRSRPEAEAEMEATDAADDELVDEVEVGVVAALIGGSACPPAGCPRAVFDCALVGEWDGSNASARLSCCANAAAACCAVVAMARTCSCTGGG